MRLIKITLLLVVFVFLGQPDAFSASGVEGYLCELGIGYYKQGNYQYALHELKKVLLLNPQNQTAKDYINKILSEQKALPKGLVIKEKEAEGFIGGEKMVGKVLDRVEAESLAQAKRLAEMVKAEKQALMPKELEEALPKKEEGVSPLKISGEVQLRLGATPEETVWKRANFDFNERNWRMLSEAALNQRENTYDSRIYDRLRINLDTDNQEGFNFHSNITVDPWSFTGKSDKITLTGCGGDSVEIELKYCSNTGYTINETVYTLKNGDSINIPEIKVTDGKTSPVTITSAWGNIFYIPELKIHREFQPVRELWFDYQKEGSKFGFFPFAYENQALTTDDPLRLSNNHIWWEDSPWVRKWRPGIENSGTLPQDFFPGYWDSSLLFKDSEGSRLTQLRGFSFEFQPTDETSIETTFATPKDLWQEYSNVDNIISATRVKHKLEDDLSIGATYTMRTGFNLNQADKTDARNNVVGVDLDYEISEGIKTSFEVAYSQSDYDLTSSQYKTESRGNAYYFSVIGRYPRKSIIDTEYGYDGIEPEEKEEFFNKFRFFGAHMDEGFDPSLSSYRETRDDEFWSRHIHFRKPFKYYFIGFYQDSLTWDDIKPYRIGNGIDVGRDVIGFRIGTSWEDKLNNLFDIRNVHQTNGKYIETVARDEVTWEVNDRLTAKALAIYHDLPKTKAGVDPFIFDSLTGRYFDNAQIEDGKDPSIKTGSLGLEYGFFDWLAVNGIWERTNDYCLGYDNFPRGVLKDDTTPSYTWWEGGSKYRGDGNWLYEQEFFPRPPYPYYDIFKLGLRLNPVKKLEVYLDYTRNEFESAGQIDDNINHFGIGVSYLPTPKLGLFLRYTYSRWQDLDRLTQGITKPAGHHNFFAEFLYRKSEDEDFALQYGEVGRSPMMGEMMAIGCEPYGGTLPTIDTEHIIRLYYSRRF